MNYADLADKQKNELLRKSHDLMISITEIWGAERGMELWESIADSLGPEIKGDLFFAMITGKGIGPVHLISINSARCVDIIRLIRAQTGLGLKEAKDIYDHVRDKGPADIEVVDGPAKLQFKQELRDLGCEVR